MVLKYHGAVNNRCGTGTIFLQSLRSSVKTLYLLRPWALNERISNPAFFPKICGAHYLPAVGNADFHRSKVGSRQEDLALCVMH
jgi:hypothetical protein